MSLNIMDDTDGYGFNSQGMRESIKCIHVAKCINVNAIMKCMKNMSVNSNSKVKTL